MTEPAQPAPPAPSAAQTDKIAAREALKQRIANATPATLVTGIFCALLWQLDVQRQAAESTRLQAVIDAFAGMCGQ